MHLTINGEDYKYHRNYVKRHRPYAKLCIDDYGNYQIFDGDEKISAKKSTPEKAWSNAFLFVFDS